MDLESRLHDLSESLGELKPEDKAPWQIGAIFNALLEQVRKEHGDDPVVAVIEAAERNRSTTGPGNFATVTNGALRAATKQLYEVTRGS